MAEIEFITLCDAAQSINGKLYILGGAWSQINRLVVQNAAQRAAASKPVRHCRINCRRLA